MKKKPNRAAKARFKAGAQALASRSRFMDNIDGITFQGRRNMYQALGYSRNITPQMYRSRFRRNGVAQRIVTAFPKATWRGGAEVIDDPANPNQTAFELAWEALEKRLNVWAVFRRADDLAGLGRYATILLGTPGDLEQPLEQARPQDLVYLTPFSEEDAQVEKFDTDVKSPRFGLPVYYAIRRLAPTGTVRQNTPELVGRRVHFSRIIHIADGLLDDHVYGLPRLEKCWNLLDDLEKVTGGGAEAFWKRADQGMVISIDPMTNLKTDAQGNSPELENLKRQVEDYEQALKRVLTVRGVKVNTLGSQVADISTSVSALMTQIAAATEIPQRILMGSEAAKLASLTDADTWDERVLDRRSEYAAPQIVRPFVNRLIEKGILPKPKDDSYDVSWPEMKNLNESQRMDLAGKAADINNKSGHVVVTDAEIREKYLGLDAVGASRGPSAKLPVVDNAPGELDPAPGFTGQDDVPANAAPGQLNQGANAPAAPPKTAKSRWASRGKETAARSHLHEAADRFSGPGGEGRGRRDRRRA